MHLVHYTSLSCEVEQLTSLSPIAIKLQEIGVYNTWFDLFSKYFTNHDLRNLPNGDELHNAVFVRMSFILYSLGVSKMSIPYLDFFYNNFPESKLIPMILYSQSMTYGRYQVPVDLEKAEKYALMNLEKLILYLKITLNMSILKYLPKMPLLILEPVKVDCKRLLSFVQ